MQTQIFAALENKKYNYTAVIPKLIELGDRRKQEEQEKWERDRRLAQAEAAKQKNPAYQKEQIQKRLTAEIGSTVIPQDIQDALEDTFGMIDYKAFSTVDDAWKYDLSSRIDKLK